jgi:hypothetical protein
MDADSPKPFPLNCPKIEIIKTCAILHLPLWLKNSGRSDSIAVGGERFSDEPVSERFPTQSVSPLTVPPDLIDTILSDSFHHLFQLELDQRRLRVVVPVFTRRGE